MPNNCPWITLNNGVKMPQLGLGVVFLEDGEMMQTAVDSAIDAGYRLFDNAASYGNEAAVGNAIKNNGIKREEVFISTKLRNSKHKYDDALFECDKSMKNLGVDYLDLYLIHFPCPGYDLYCEAWKALEHLYKEGMVRAIGVSNFHGSHLEKIFGMCEIPPTVNQLECNPYLQIAPLREYCQDHNIWPEAWFPLGGPADMPRDETTAGKVLLKDPVINELAEKYGRSPAQIVLRWETQSGIIVIPKSRNPGRIKENISIFDFDLSGEDMRRVDALDCGFRLGADPDLCNDQF